MIRWRALLYAFFLLTILEVHPIVAKRSSSHSYPKSGGLSGGGHHSYPHSSGGLSGGGRGYPSSGGLSGGGHGYPSSGGSSGGGHGYPSSGGLSGGGHGYPSGGGLSGGGKSPSYPTNSGYPSSSNNNRYPTSSNNHRYPSSGGISGSSNRYPSGGTHSTHTTTVHHHYHYSPPQQIRYTPVGGGVPMSYPVYRGTPPTYVYQYKDSGSKYGTLLAGLALLNLGTLAGAVYASSHHGSGGSSTYKTQPGEVCKFAIKKDNGDYEETRINCQLISSFIYQEQAKTQSPTNTSANTITTTTVTNVTVVNNTGVPQPAPAVTPQLGNIIYTMLPNGTLVPLNGTNVNSTATAPAQPSPNNTITSSMTVTTTTTNTTVVDALSVKGKPIEVTPGMQCFVIRLSPMGNMRKSVPCGLLQSYADQSLKKNSAVRNVPVLTVLAAVVTACLVY